MTMEGVVSLCTIPRRISESRKALKKGVFGHVRKDPTRWGVGVLLLVRQRPFPRPLGGAQEHQNSLWSQRRRVQKSQDLRSSDEFIKVESLPAIWSRYGEFCLCACVPEDTTTWRTGNTRRLGHTLFCRNVSPFDQIKMECLT